MSAIRQLPERYFKLDTSFTMALNLLIMPDTGLPVISVFAVSGNQSTLLGSPTVTNGG